MKAMFRLEVLVAMVLAIAVSAGFAAVRADDLAAADRSAIRDMIAGQIAAFGADDGEAAYAYASPSIRRLFPTVEQFMAMVKTGYPQVYRPQSVVFGPLAGSPEGPLQTVYLTGPDGETYTAIYSLERQADGSWLINGCYIVRGKGPEA